MSLDKRRFETGYGLTNALPSLAKKPIVSGRAPRSIAGGDKAQPGQMWVYQTKNTTTDAVYVLVETISGVPYWKSLSGGTGAGAITPASIATAGTVNLTAPTSVSGVLVTDAAGLVSASRGTNGQLLIGSTGVTPTWASMTSNDGTIVITPTPGGIDIRVPGAGTDWLEVTATPAGTMVVNQGYMVKPSAALVVLTLPTTAETGTVIRVALNGSTFGWKIAQNASQYIYGVQAPGSNNKTTVGAAGYITCVDPSTGLINDFASVELLCTTANLGWQILSSVGQIDFQ